MRSQNVPTCGRIRTRSMSNCAYMGHPFWPWVWAKIRPMNVLCETISSLWMKKCHWIHRKSSYIILFLNKTGQHTKRRQIQSPWPVWECAACCSKLSGLGNWCFPELDPVSSTLRRAWWRFDDKEPESWTTGLLKFTWKTCSVITAHWKRGREIRVYQV